MSNKKQLNANFIAAVVSIVFAALALTFGMGDWKQAPTTASAPPAVTQH